MTLILTGGLHPNTPLSGPKNPKTREADTVQTKMLKKGEPPTTNYNIYIYIDIYIYIYI